MIYFSINAKPFFMTVRNIQKFHSTEIESWSLKLFILKEFFYWFLSNLAFNLRHA